MTSEVYTYLQQQRNVILKLLGSLVIWWLAFSHWMDPLVAWFGAAEIHQQNLRYFTDLRATASQDLARLSELSAAIEIARSSEVGVSFFASFDVEVGNLLHSFAGFLQRAVEVSLTSLAMIELLILTSDFTHWVSPWLFQLIFLSLAVVYLSTLLRLHARVVAEAALFVRLMTYLFLVVYFVIPYSFHISTLIGNGFVQPQRQAVSASLVNMHGDVMRPASLAADLKTHAKSSLHHLDELRHNHLSQKVAAMSRHVFKSTALSVFDLLMIPLILIILLSLVVFRIASGLHDWLKAND